MSIKKKMDKDDITIIKIIQFIIIIIMIFLLTAEFLIRFQDKMYTNDLIEYQESASKDEVCGNNSGCEISDEMEIGYSTGMYIPNITFTDFEGNEYALYDLMEGKDWFIIQFGVEWCGDCKRDHEKLATYYEDLPEEIGFISVYVDYSKEDDPEKQASYESAKADSEMYPWQSFYDANNELMRKFNVVNTPTTVIVQGDGKIKAVTSEMDTDKLLLPNTDEVIYPVPTQETYDAAN